MWPACPDEGPSPLGPAHTAALCPRTSRPDGILAGCVGGGSRRRHGGHTQAHVGMGLGTFIAYPL